MCNLKFIYCYLLLFASFKLPACSMQNRAFSMRNQGEPMAILENFNALRQNSFLDWIVSLLGLENGTADSSFQPVKRECADCTCGTVNTAHRIVGGQETEVNEYPWMALLMWFGSFYCGATLINDQYALTAAHCVNGFYYRLITVRLLEHNRQNSSIRIIDRRVSQVYVHEKYSMRSFDNDIALIRFTKSVKLDGDMHPVCLPTPKASFAGKTGIITGWGALREGGPTSDTLQEVQVPILSLDECRNSSYGMDRITDNMICAGYEEGGKDSCQGDSGGPMHVLSEDGAAYQLAGIVSWGEGCARPSSPGVYTRVNQFNDWIANHTRDACSCRQVLAESGTNISEAATTAAAESETEVSESKPETETVAEQETRTAAVATVDTKFEQ